MKKEKEIKALKNEIRSLKAQSPTLPLRGYSALSRLAKNKSGGSSGVIISITRLSGSQIVEPTFISGGLAPETIEGLMRDFKRSYYRDTELCEFGESRPKPKDVQAELQTKGRSKRSKRPKKSYWGRFKSYWRGE